MIWLDVKFFLPPIFAATVIGTEIVDAVPPGIRAFLQLATLAVVLAGLVVVGKTRAESKASAGAAAAWELERNAAVSKAERLESQIRADEQLIAELRIKIKELESRPTLEQVEGQLERLTTLMTRTAEAVQQTVEKGTTTPTS